MVPFQGQGLTDSRNNCSKKKKNLNSILTFCLRAEETDKCDKYITYPLTLIFKDTLQDGGNSLNIGEKKYRGTCF